MRFTNPSWTGPRMLAAWTLLALAGSGVLAAQASAKGGTAKPPQNAVSPIVTPTLADPAWSVDPAQLRGFDVTGYIQASTVGNNGCPRRDRQEPLGRQRHHQRDDDHGALQPRRPDAGEHAHLGGLRR